MKKWNVKMRCVVMKEVHLSECTEDEALSSPWDHADDEHEIEQIDWEVVSIEEDK